MTKVILSRKGYDSSYGGGASPILPNGDLISIPIPANDNEKGISYSKIRYGENSYLELMEELGVKIPKSKTCHFDPDLIKEAYDRKENWNGILGQQGAALTHLENQNVTKGDIFLFFGSFKRTYRNSNLNFERDYERHIIFGYLIVSQIIKIEEAKNSIFEEHPHFQNQELFAPRNTVYIANSEEDYGVFKYRDELVLTKSGFPKSMWDLPMIFHPSRGTKISRHSEKDFEIRDNSVFLKTRGIGQDFVISGNAEIVEWAKKIIGESKKMKPACNIKG
ncbi:MAG: hypothetical protein AAF573_11770 [Bacteroidota bacterium]